MTITTDRFEALRIERNDDGEILLTCPDMTGNGDDVIMLHPAQARRIGELAGNREADRGVARLRRRLLMIDSQAERLARWLRECSDHEHADLAAETLMANTLADLTADAVTDFSADPPEPAQAAPALQAGPAAGGGARARTCAAEAASGAKQAQGTLL